MQGKCVFFVFVRECAGCGVIWSNFLHFLKLVSKLYFRKLYIVDARPRKNALANGAMGGGSKIIIKLFSIRVLLGIDNIHAMRDRFVRLREYMDTYFKASSDGISSFLVSL
ncbi:hypothetical protein VIGAN_02010200 [Vigna angularis var. angularis]|uniref:Myotubularin phosphatase domain-containing protein n=1 Tax=Vigna angularis var. angularis TaxID=157739 RepID=A0A0S3RAV9_PHAAN|nr:hypothetical protein VIGAN_02010200 [Vigna angularis var. angularis]